MDWKREHMFYVRSPSPIWDRVLSRTKVPRALYRFHGPPETSPGDQGDVTLDEADYLDRWGTWMNALERGFIKPMTPAQEHFVSCIRGDVPAETFAERLWRRYQEKRKGSVHECAALKAEAAGITGPRPAWLESPKFGYPGWIDLEVAKQEDDAALSGFIAEYIEVGQVMELFGWYAKEEEDPSYEDGVAPEDSNLLPDGESELRDEEEEREGFFAPEGDDESEDENQELLSTTDDHEDED
jgi:uncharacterized protein YifE (UPF0438 family)